MLSDGLYSLIVADPTVAGILATRSLTPGAPETSGVFPVQMPEADPLPAIVYTQIHGDGVMSMDGPDPLKFARFQFSCYGATYRESKILARALLNLLENFTGALSDGTGIGNMERVGEMDAFHEAPYVFVTHVDVKITYDDLGTPTLTTFAGLGPYQAGAGPQFAFADAEIPSGVVNGVNKVFTLAHAPNPPLSLQLVMNGAVQEMTADFSLSGNTITFVTAPPSLSNLEARYRY